MKKIIFELNFYADCETFKADSQAFLQFPWRFAQPSTHITPRTKEMNKNKRFCNTLLHSLTHSLARNRFERLCSLLNKSQSVKMNDNEEQQ
jgi:hypothetical protein